MRSKVVYRINFENCECLYVGKTFRQLNFRQDKHKKRSWSRQLQISVFKHYQLTGY